jgi:hypothetical protein
MNTEMITKYIVLQKQLEIEELRRNERKAGIHRYEETNIRPIHKNGRKPDGVIEPRKRSALASTKKTVTQEKSTDITSSPAAGVSSTCCCRQNFRKAVHA